jgi:hypothetical protein
MIIQVNCETPKSVLVAIYITHFNASRSITYSTKIYSELRNVLKYITYSLCSALHLAFKTLENLIYIKSLYSNNVTGT